MRAILLAAGIGRRMGPDAPPKCLLPIGGRSLLQITLESLRAAGIGDLALVVGYRSREVREEATRHGGSLKLTFLENPRFKEGAILSLWTARALLDDDLLIMDADVLCPQAAFERLVRSAHPNCLLVDPSAADTGEEQMVFGSAGRVFCITKRPSQEVRSRWACFGESIGFLKLDREAAGTLGELLDRKVGEGVTDIEHEQVYPELFQRVQVGCEEIQGLPWAEIDTPEDLKRAEEEILPGWSAPLCLNRAVARWFFPWIVKFPVSPNQWTALSLLIGLAAARCVAHGGYGWGLAGALLFEAFYLVDDWDGEVARARGLSSRWGGWFDVTVDSVVQVTLGLALAVGLKAQGAPSWVVPLGWVAAGGLTLDFLVTAWAKARGFGPGIFGDPSRGQAAASDSGPARWIRANLTHENFSLLAAAMLILDWRAPFLIAMAIGTQIFWLQFLLKNRPRLLTLNP
ncbi:MAG: NTP transferase domain-containing protein [Candidatus Omnitrophica bacterium]|nr:NTP transferase domain-containing protein [Candidatus Omnitrophota bacterium]